MKLELSYAAVFTSAVLLTGAVLWSLAHQPYAISAEEVINSCRQVSNSLLSSNFHIRNILGLALIGLSLKALFSVWKTYSKLDYLQQHQTAKLPAKLKRVYQKNKLDLNQVMVINHPQKVAMTLGLGQLKIVLSNTLIRSLSPKQLEAVVLHEQYHLRHAHPALFIWGELVSSTLFFLPSLGDLVGKMKSQLEVKADSFAIESQKTSRFLKQAVVKTLENTQPAPSFAPGFASTALEKRVARLANKKHIERPSFNLLKLLITLLVIGTSLGMLYKPTTIQARTQQTQNQSKCGFLQCVSSCVQQELMSKSRR